MGIKYIHVVLIFVSIGLAIGFGLWTFNHNFVPCAYASLAIAVGLIAYGIKFIQQMKAL